MWRKKQPCWSWSSTWLLEILVEFLRIILQTAPCHPPVKTTHTHRDFPLGFYLINLAIAPHAVLSSICKAVLVKLTFIFSESSPGSFGEETPTKTAKQTVPSFRCVAQKRFKKTNTTNWCPKNCESLWFFFLSFVSGGCLVNNFGRKECATKKISSFQLIHGTGIFPYTSTIKINKTHVGTATIYTHHQLCFPPWSPFVEYHPFDWPKSLKCSSR